ncbi:S1 family peptidase [Puniceicoccus vermicola]|uniref:Trypsin-like peptidase domain-containing protein n=1 Tax=Puniceicoccus vermicola TaxID=388746 RepID=A0A7X1E5T3_9BACT|nr:serine protease [Puniceicoccus vermicola]MBC2603393.1 trypsin-like peptidase domain-containing protein [Puniceicoccus vermicola]
MRSVYSLKWLILIWVSGCFLAPIAGWGGGPPTSLVKADGSVVSGEVRDVEGSEVLVATGPSETERFPLVDLAEDSREEVLLWALPLILENDNAFQVRFYRKIESSVEDPEVGTFEVAVNNRSQLDLPEDLHLEFVIHRLDFLPLWGLDDSKKYRMTEARNEKMEIPFDGIPSGEERSYGMEAVELSDADLSLPWSEILGEEKKEDQRAEILTKVFLEVRLFVGDQLVGSFPESVAASELLAEKGLGGSQKLRRGRQGAAPVRYAPRAGPSIEIPLETLVIIDADFSTGSGFLAKIKGKPFLVTNAHVLAGAQSIKARTVGGRSIAIPDFCYLAGDRDLALIPVKDEGDFLVVSEDIAKTAAIGDPITVFGNEAGAAVATELRGNVRGIGPKQVEIDALIVEGNSGSPVIHDKSQETVGVVAYYIEYEVPRADEARWRSERGIPNADPRSDLPPEVLENLPPEVRRNLPGRGPTVIRRRFAERLDNADSWEQISFVDLSREGTAFEEYQELVTGVAEIAVQIMRTGTLPNGGYDSRELQRLVRRFHRQFDDDNRPGSAENERALNSLRYQLFSLMDSRKRETRGKISTAYFQGEFDRLSVFGGKVRTFWEGLEVY